MEQNESVEKKNNSSSPRGGPRRKNSPCTFEERLRAVKLHLEEGFTQEMVAREMGLSSAAVYKWVARYRLQGEEALKKLSQGFRRRSAYHTGRRGSEPRTRTGTVHRPLGPDHRTRYPQDQLAP